MAVKVGKKNVSAYAQLECEKQLKYNLIGKRGLEPGAKRPGISHIATKGKEYEASIYNDFLELLNEKEICYSKIEEEFENINLLDVLLQSHVPRIVIEAEFDTPNIFNYDEKYFKYSKSRPDLIFITKNEKVNKYIISIIDIKTTTEPSLKHFSEVSFYKLGLEALLKEKNLNDKFAVDVNGYIWPGNNDPFVLINTFNYYKSRNSLDILYDTLTDVLTPVPFEIYEPFVLNFFNNILPDINNKHLDSIHWQFSPKCQFCDHEPFCKKESNENSLLSQIPFLSNGQHSLLKKFNINTVADVIKHIEENSNEWMQIVNLNRNLKIQKDLILSRAKAILENKVNPIENRKTYMMPSFVNLNIFITLHFDPITGITFAMGADKVYKDKGIETEKKQIINIVGSANKFDIKYEREQFLIFLKKINEWLKEFLKLNKEIKGVSQFKLKSIHIYFWSQLEVKQLRRMILRHINDKKVQKELELLISLYPPEKVKDNPDIYETQPGTVVKDVVKYLFGLPINYEYTVFNAANAFIKEFDHTQNPYQYKPARGFYLELSDQIPFERAYEIWTGKVFLPREFKSEEKYQRFEIEKMLNEAIALRLEALQKVVNTIQINYQDRLLQVKKKVKKFATGKTGMEQESINLQIFEKLNHISSDIENKQLRVLPIDEKENRFFSIRNLMLQDSGQYSSLIQQLMNKESFRNCKFNDFLVFSYSSDSIEAKLKEGDFLVSLSNEKDPRDNNMPQLVLDTILTKLSEYSADELLSISKRFNVKNIKNFSYISLKSLLSVTIAYVSYEADNLFIIVVPNDYYGGINVIHFLEYIRLLDLNTPMILDPLYQDFNQDTFEKIFRAIGKQ